MALQRLKINGYGQIELNQVAFRRDGRIEAQCKLDESFTLLDDFNNVVEDGIFAENGMLLAVDNVKRLIHLPEDDTTSHLIALNYTTEHLYDERALGLKNFKLPRGTFLPRLGYLALGDKYTTNCLAYDDGEFADEEALTAALDAIDTTPLYAVPCSIGAHKITATAPTDGVALQVILKTTMPDGQLGVKLQAVAV